MEMASLARKMQDVRKSKKGGGELHPYTLGKRDQRARGEGQGQVTS